MLKLDTLDTPLEKGWTSRRGWSPPDPFRPLWVHPSPRSRGRGAEAAGHVQDACVRHAVAPERHGRRSGSGGTRRRQGLPWWVITIAVVLLLWLLFGR